MQSTLRKIQDDLANAGWRINHISHAPEGKPVVVGFENWAGYVTVIAAIPFPIALGIAIYKGENGRDPLPWVYLAIASWAICLAGLVVKNKIKKKDWIYVDAKCIDREVRKGSGRNGTIWASRILCEFEHNGITIQCTPTVHWSTWRSESDAHQFIDSRIDPSGGCTLKVNPRNPREANLSDRRMK